MMNYCLIALHERFRYRCIYCRSRQDLLQLLQENYGQADQACGLVNLGDISQIGPQGVRSYSRDWGFQWSTTRPTVLNTRTELLEFALHSRIRTLYLHNGTAWRALAIDKDYSLERVA